MESVAKVVAGGLWGLNKGERLFPWQSDRGNDTKGHHTLIAANDPEQLAIGLWSALI